MSEQESDARELKAEAVPEIAAPDLPYQPPKPKSYQPRIGIIGCGGIVKSHLEAYAKMGYEVVAFSDIDRAAAEAYREKYVPDAQVTTDAAELLAREDIDVVDIATHPAPRIQLIRDALEAGKHVLSQKPFVTDLAVGRELVELAEAKNRKLAVNQNGRWAPHFSYLREAVNQGLLGDVVSVDIYIAWDHTWIKGTHFEKIHHIVLYDFAIHWFDIVSSLMGERQAAEVFARAQKTPGQPIDPPLSAHAAVRYDNALATLVFHANTPHDPAESIVVTGTKGTYRASGPVCACDQITLTTAEGRANVQLEGAWFDDGFAGAMGELLCAIEEDREPTNNARDNLRSLELCFAAIASADSGQPVAPGAVQTVSV
jgi:predicted dehydrogenase